MNTNPFELCLTVVPAGADPVCVTGAKSVCITPPAPCPKLVVPLSFGEGFKVVGDNVMTTLNSVQKVTLGPVTAADLKGNPAPIENLVFSTNEPAILSLVDNGDGTATVSSVGPVGTAQVRVDADAHIGEGEKALTATLDFEVIAAEGATLTVPVGAVEEQP